MGTFPRGLWSRDLGGGRAWEKLEIAGSQPSGRVDASLVLDSRRHQLVLFGGVDSLGQALADVWVLPLDGAPEWSIFAPNAIPPAARHAHAAIYDVAGDRLVVSCGVGDGQVNLGDTWALSLGGVPAWNQIPSVSSPPPGATVGFYDPLGPRLVAFFPGSPVQVRALPLTEGGDWTAIATLNRSPDWTANEAEYEVPGALWKTLASTAFDPVHRAAPFLWEPDRVGHFYDGISPYRLYAPVLRLDPLPTLHLTADSLTVRYYFGAAQSKLHLTIAGHLYDRLVVTSGVGDVDREWTGFPDSVGRFPFELGVAPGLSYAFHMSWFDGQAARDGGTFIIQTPPPPLDIGLRLDSLYVTGRYLHVIYSTSDSARMLTRVHFEYSAADGPWQTLWDGFGFDTTGLGFDHVAPDYLYKFRVSWGDPPFPRIYSKVDTFRTPQEPVWVGSVSTPQGLEMRWTLRAGTRFEGTLHRFPNGREDSTETIGTVTADPSGLIFFRDTRAVPGVEHIYYLVWSVGGVEVRDTGVGAGHFTIPAFYRAYAEPHQVHLYWIVERDTTWVATVYRSAIPYASESAIGSVRPDDHGLMVALDRTVVPGTTYRYRLGWPTASDGSTTTGWEEVIVPLDSLEHQTPPTWLPAHAWSDRVDLAWKIDPHVPFAGSVRRRLEGTPVSADLEVGPVHADTLSGLIEITDKTVAPSTSYRYSLTWSSDGEFLNDGGHVVSTSTPPPTLALSRAVPNPAQAWFEIDCSIPDHNPARLDLIDVSGRRVSTQWVPGPATRRIRVDTAGLSVGVYVARLSHANAFRAVRVVVVR